MRDGNCRRAIFLISITKNTHTPLQKSDFNGIIIIVELIGARQVVKVLVVITSGLGREGITSATLETFRNMDFSSLAIDVLDVAGADESVVTDFEKLGCRVIKTPHRKKQLSAYRKALKKLMEQEKYDVVHVHGSSAIMSIELGIAKKCGVKTRIAHSHNTQNPHRLVDKLLRPYFYSKFNLALACGQDAGKFLFGKRTFRVFHNGKNFDNFKFSQESRDKIRKKYNYSDAFVFGFVGRINDQKNPLFLVDVLRETLKMRPNSKLLLIGDGYRRQEFINYATEQGVMQNVIITGAVNNVHELIQAPDVMILPSLYEGLPIVATEWQVAGLNAFISDRVTRECAPTDLVKFLPIDKGAKIWADAICSLDEKRTRKERSDYACEQLKKEGFEIKECAERLKNIYLGNN